MNKKLFFSALFLSAIFILPSAFPLYALEDGSQSAGSANDPDATGSSSNAGTTGQDDDDDPTNTVDTVETNDMTE
jgi:hypothetical protein